MTIRIVTVKQKGQITLPADLRRKYHFEEDSKVAIEERAGALVMSHPEDVVDPTAGIFKDYAYTRNPDVAEEKAWIASHIAETADPRDE